MPDGNAADFRAIGPITLARVVESEGPLLRPGEIFPDSTPEIIRGETWLAPRFYDPSSDRLVISIQSFLIKTAHHTILVDTCAGNHKDRKREFFNRREWPWLDALHRAGAAPEDIDIVLCSHLHVDHVGWNTRLENGRWVPTFPNAHYLFSRRELEYWQEESQRDGIMRTGDYVADSVVPILEAGRAVLIDGEHAIDDRIRLTPTPGHTPGHFAVDISAGGERAILSGDLFHHELQCRYPDWSTNFCWNKDLARASRRAFFEEHADSGTAILPAHLPTPTAGFIERAGEAYRFRYDEP